MVSSSFLYAVWLDDDGNLFRVHGVIGLESSFIVFPTSVFQQPKGDEKLYFNANVREKGLLERVGERRKFAFNIVSFLIHSLFYLHIRTH